MVVPLDEVSGGLACRRSPWPTPWALQGTAPSRAAGSCPSDSPQTALESVQTFWPTRLQKKGKLSVSNHGSLGGSRRPPCHATG